MKGILLIALLLLRFATFAAEPDTAELRKSAISLNQALTSKDTATLKKLLHKKVAYGHSNGWVENKRSIIEDLYNGKLVYKNITTGPLTITEEENIASVRTDTEVDIVYEGQELKMKLHVLQVWIKGKKGWLLISRQSTKI